MLNGYVDDMANFVGDGKRGVFSLKNSDISSKQMQLGIPYNTPLSEWLQLRGQLIMPKQRELRLS